MLRVNKEYKVEMARMEQLGRRDPMEQLAFRVLMAKRVIRVSRVLEVILVYRVCRARLVLMAELVTLDQMEYHTQCVARGTKRAFVMSDLPFGSYQASREQAMHSATRLMAAGAHCVKLEGGLVMAETIRFLVERGVPVCAHLGLTPQSVHQLGGYKVQGKSEAEADRLKADALALQDAGAALLVLEMVPAALAAEVTRACPAMPTIGIGAGVDCAGQILVLHDMIGIYPGKTARFVRNFMEGADSIEQAISHYVKAVKDKSFPAPEHSY